MLLFTAVFSVVKCVAEEFISLHHYSGYIPIIRGDTMHFSSCCGPFSQGKMSQSEVVLKWRFITFVLVAACRIK